MGNRLSLPFRRDSAEDMADILLNYESLLISLSYFFDMDVVKMCKCQGEASVLKGLFNHDTIFKTHVPMGTEIITKGEALKGLYIIDTGVVGITKNTYDAPIQLEQGRHFGMDKPFQVQLGNVCDITAKTTTDCCLWFIERSTLLRLEKMFKDIRSNLDSNELDDSVKGSVQIIEEERKAVSFNPTVKVVLMATKEEYKAWSSFISILFQFYFILISFSE